MLLDTLRPDLKRCLFYWYKIESDLKGTSAKPTIWLHMKPYIKIHEGIVDLTAYSFLTPPHWVHAVICTFQPNLRWTCWNFKIYSMCAAGGHICFVYLQFSSAKRSKLCFLYEFTVDLWVLSRLRNSKTWKGWQRSSANTENIFLFKKISQFPVCKWHSWNFQAKFRV